MGAKGRVIPGFLDRVLEREVPEGGTVVDLMSGTGVVGAFCADRYRVFSNDAQDYSRVIAASLIEHEPRQKRRFLQTLDPVADLTVSYERNLRQLRELYGKEIARERALLERYGEDEGDESWCRDYRRFLERTSRLDAARDGRWLREYRDDPRRRPARLVTAYWSRVYYSVEQASAIDSLRAAIDDLDSDDPFHAERRTHYLSALLHAASVTTSGTSHFAQPRHLRKDSELCAMARRRRTDVWSVFTDYSGEIAETVRTTRHRAGNRAFQGDYASFVLPDSRGIERFEFPVAPDLVYLDPPYTADNYSRFYHVLEVLVRYDYPPLARDSSGVVLRGRYPEIGQRFRSGFCSAGRVEAEFRRVIAATAAAKAKLVISYAAPGGLLLKRYRRLSPSADPVASFEALCREAYSSVRTERRPLMHSGQGDSNVPVDELLLVCTKPKRSRALSRGS